MPPLDRETLKSYLIRDKAFLRSLFTGSNTLKNRRLILAANEGEIDTLIKYLHYLVNGKIKISASSFQGIQKSRKLAYLRKTFESRKSFELMLTSDDRLKRSFVLKLGNNLSDLLTPLFVFPSKQQKLKHH